MPTSCNPCYPYTMNALLDQPVQESRTDRGESGKSHRFQKGNPGKPKGTQDKVTRSLKEAILIAARRQGNVIAGHNIFDPGGLVEYLQHLAAHEPRVMGALIGKCLPLDVTSSDGSMRPVVALYMPDNHRDQPKLVQDARPPIEHDPTPAVEADTPAPPVLGPATPGKA